VSGAIERVLTAATARRPAEAWLDARGRIVSDRANALRVVASGTPVYGFSTLLGHLDSVSSSGAADQQLLLDAHLVGPRSEASGTFLDLVSACKAEQLSHGGSGVREETYLAVLDAFGSLPARGAWLASYSSGDVVPAAWWASARVVDRLTEFDAGDVICLINGSFYGAAHAMGSASSALAAIVQVLARLSRTAPALSGVGVPEVDALRPYFLSHVAISVQRPVSLRDASPSVLTLVRAVRDAIDAVEHRLGAPSANPLFVGGETLSQSSFLDFETTRALRGLEMAVRLAAGLVQRMIVEGCDAATPAGVQPPKIAAAALVAHRSPGLASFVGDESHGIEDLRDLSLIASCELSAAVTVVETLLDIHDAALGAPGPTTVDEIAGVVAATVAPRVSPSLLATAARVRLPL